MLPIHFAPLQGYTDFVYRNFHEKIFGGVDYYYTPFIRLEQGELRKKDLKDILPENDLTKNLVPQVIVKDIYELDTLVSVISGMGYGHIDINMGCPFPMQVKKGRGAGLLPKTDLVREICDFINAKTNLDFSIKMRLGSENADECMQLLPVLNSTRLKHIAVHPRIAKQQYKGELNIDQFQAFLDASRNPVVFNGELKSVDDIEKISKAYPSLAGIMIGRGLLTRPSLASEYKNCSLLNDDELLCCIMKLHDGVFAHYAESLQGDSHLLMKMKTFWEYLEELIGHKRYKLIKKAVNVAKYNAALQL